MLDFRIEKLAALPTLISVMRITAGITLAVFSPPVQCRERQAIRILIICQLSRLAMSYQNEINLTLRDYFLAWVSLVTSKIDDLHSTKLASCLSLGTANVSPARFIRSLA